MKTYIILTGSIYDMGGAEMFTSNKCTYLKSIGWNVRVFFFNKGHKILIDNLNEFIDNYIPELKYGYYYWSKKQRDRVLSRICKGLNYGDEVVVESHLMNLTYWGELIADYIGAKSILNCMEEKIAQLTPLEAAFVEHKLKRYEVLNGTPSALRRYLGTLYKPEYNQYGNTMIPLCSNVVSDNSEINIDVAEADFNLLSIGRLDKPYVQTMLTGVKRFVEEYGQHSFNLLVVGGSPDGSVENQIRNMFENISNVTIYLFGYLYPIPAILMRMSDVSMASANSVLVSADQGIPTIVYDMADFQTIGVYGHTTNNRFRRQREPATPTENLLAEILIENKYVKVSAFTADSDLLEKVFVPQLEFLYKSPNDHSAFDVMAIHSRIERCIANLKRLVLTALGKW